MLFPRPEIFSCYGSGGPVDCCSLNCSTIIEQHIGRNRGYTATKSPEDPEKTMIPILFSLSF